MYDSSKKVVLLNGTVTTLLEVSTFYPLFPTHSVQMSQLTYPPYIKASKAVRYQTGPWLSGQNPHLSKQPSSRIRGFEAP